MSGRLLDELPPQQRNRRRLWRLSCWITFCAGIGNLSAAAADLGPQPMTGAVISIGPHRLIPHVRVTPHPRPNQKTVDLTYEVQGELWLADPFFHADWPCYAMVVLWCGDDPRPPQFLHSRGRTAFGTSRGGMILTSGAIVGSRFLAEIARPPAKTDVGEQEWFVQLLVLDGAAFDSSAGTRSLPEWRIVGRSDRASLGTFPTNARISLVRPAASEESINNEIPLEAILQHPRAGETPNGRRSVEVLFVNRGTQPLPLFDPFLQNWKLTPFPGRLWLQTQGAPRARRNLLDPGAWISYVRANRLMVFEVPANGLCGSRVELPPIPVGVAATLRLELDKRFLCGERAVNPSGFFEDAGFAPAQSRDIDLLVTTPVELDITE